MDVIEAIRSRRSIRGFKPDPVPRKIIEEILETSLWAPSARNTQSWGFAILGGKMMNQLKARLLEREKANVKENPDLGHVAELQEPYLSRAELSRYHIDIAQFPPGTERLDEKRGEYWMKGGGRFHDAPNAIILLTEKALGGLAILEGGIMTQTIALAALPYGLGTCLMQRPVWWPDVIREFLGIPETKLVSLAIAIGYPDPAASINSGERSREPLETFAQWHGI